MCSNFVPTRPIPAHGDFQENASKVTNHSKDENGNFGETGGSRALAGGYSNWLVPLWSFKSLRPGTSFLNKVLRCMDGTANPLMDRG